MPQLANRDFYQWSLQYLLIHDNPKVQELADNIARELNREQFYMLNSAVPATRLPFHDREVSLQSFPQSS